MSADAPIVFTIILLIVAMLGALFAITGLRVFRRLKRVPTCSVAELAEGPAEVTGRVRALSQPLCTLAGTHVVALRTAIEITYKSGSKVYRDPWALDQIQATRVELTDASGSCEIDAEHLIPFATSELTVMGASEFSTRHPELFAQLPRANPIVHVRTNETYVEEGAEVFVSGSATATSVEPDTDYRAMRSRYRVHGDPDRPLLLSAWPERDVSRYMLRPAVLAAGCAILAVAVIALLWRAHSYIAGAAGLS